MTDFPQIIKKRFPFIPDERLVELLSFGELIMLKEGEIFIKEGEWSQKVGFVIEGMMRNYILNDKGEQITVVFATEMQAIAPYAAVFLKRPASETTEAIEPTILYVFDFENFKKNMDVDPLYTRIYAEFLETILVAAIERIEDLTKKKPVDRYKRLLDNHGYLIERAPLKYLASYLGITAVSLSRIRKRLSKSRN